MPAEIVLVDTDTEFAKAAAGALQSAGYSVAVFSESMRALDTLDFPRALRLLITRVEFPRGKPTGISLAQMTKLRKRELAVLFVGPSEAQPFTTDIGEFVCAPIAVSELAERATRMLGRGQVHLPA